MFYVYVLKSKKDQSIYIGYTTDLRGRFASHNNGSNKSTKEKKPWELIYYEAFKDRTLAKEREINLKYYGKSLGQLKRRIGL
ncbi:MAG: GIY-YIG nuclease family protein [Patescibacteria group bacterium]|nr:GIY-YIG nuclease family protein [Patescibacteria group bacterium]